MKNTLKLTITLTCFFLITTSQIVLAANGCGTGWNKNWVRDSYGGANFTNSCNVHDACYETCGETHSNCDKQFRANLKIECRSTYNHDAHKIQKNACLKIADGYYESVKKMGGDAWRSAQNKASCSNAANKTIPAGNFKFDARDPIYYSNGQGHYCWFNSWGKFTQLTDGKWRTQSGRLSTYKMEYDGICTGGSSSSAPHPDPNF